MPQEKRNWQNETGGENTLASLGWGAAYSVKLLTTNINVQIEKRECPGNPCQHLKLLRVNEPRKKVCDCEAIISSLSS